MNTVVRHYPLPRKASFSIRMPVGARLLGVSVVPPARTKGSASRSDDGGSVARLWALCDPDAKPSTRSFVLLQSNATRPEGSVFVAPLINSVLFETRGGQA